MTKVYEILRYFRTFREITLTYYQIFLNCFNRKSNDREKITVEALAERSGISNRQIIRLRTGETEQPELDTIVAIAIGLDIPEDVSNLLLEVAGHKLLAYKEEHMLYKFFLSDTCEMSIQECNEMLIASGYDKLGKEK